MRIWQQKKKQLETLTVQPRSYPQGAPHLRNAANYVQREDLFDGWAPKTAVLDFTAYGEQEMQCFEDILQTIGTTNCFSELTIRSWSQIPVQIITGFLRETRERLVSLRIGKKTRLEGSNDDFQEFERAIDKMNRLETLELCVSLGDFRVVLHFLGISRLRKLSIRGGYGFNAAILTDDGKSQIDAALQASNNLETLEITGIEIKTGTEELLQCLATGIAKNSSLKTVRFGDDLSWSMRGTKNKWASVLTTVARGLSNNPNSVLGTIAVESCNNYDPAFEPAFLEMLRSGRCYSFGSLELKNVHYMQHCPEHRYEFKDKNLDLQLRLNGTGMGRKSYMAKTLTLKEGTDILASFSSDIDCVFHCLQTHPWLCQATDESDSRRLDSKPAPVKKGRKRQVSKTRVLEQENKKLKKEVAELKARLREQEKS